MRAVATAAPRQPGLWRAALFSTAPLIVSEYTAGAATLALDWFDELRAEVSPSQLYTPTSRILVTDEDVTAMVARITQSLHEVEAGRADVDKMMADSLGLLEDAIQKNVADSFRDTITQNAKDDPASVGWRRFARPEACKFCLMLAARGAVYTEATARFAAHGAEMNGGRKGGDCMCIAGPAFGGKGIWAEATPMQYVASRTKRTAKQKADLRAYLNHNFPDAPG